MMKKTILKLNHLAVLCCVAFLLFACSKGKKNELVPDPEPEPLTLVLVASSTDIDEGDEVSFTVTADGKPVDADIYIGNEKITDTKHTFEESGTYTVVAKKDEHTDSEEVSIAVYAVDIYVSGEMFPNAVYWKNGNLIELALASQYSYASTRGIAVHNGDVYVAGSAMDVTLVTKYWKNGVGVELPNGIGAAGITVHNGGVYVVGTDSNQKTKYWKNGVEVEVNGDYLGHHKVVTGIAVDDGGVYVAEYEYNGSVYLARYWKNDTESVPIGDGNHLTFAYDIIAHNGDVYVAGVESNGTKMVAKYWKNGAEVVTLSDGSQDAWANAIAVHNGDVYVAGAESNGTTNVAKYWKNGAEVSVLSDGNRNAVAYAIAVNNGGVYGAGTESNGSSNVAKYWSLPAGEVGNGTAVELTDGSQSAQVSGIGVVRTMK